MVGAALGCPLRHVRQQAQSVQWRPAIRHSHACRVVRGMVRVQVACREQVQQGVVRWARVVRVSIGGGIGGMTARRVVCAG